MFNHKGHSIINISLPIKFLFLSLNQKQRLAKNFTAQTAKMAMHSHGMLGDLRFQMYLSISYSSVSYYVEFVLHTVLFVFVISLFC